MLGRAREKQGEQRKQACADARWRLPEWKPLKNHGRCVMHRLSLLVSVVVVFFDK